MIDFPDPQWRMAPAALLNGHGDSGVRYFRIHEKTVSCQRLLSRGLNTQCPSFSNIRPSDGTPLRRNAVKSWSP
jgi:hypothetical protein